MWGNKLGWTISGGIVLLTIVMYAMLLLGPGVTAPTSLTTKDGAMDAISLPGSSLTLAGTGGPADASPLYQQAIDAYKADKSDFNTAASGGKLESPAIQATLPTMDLLVQAIGASKATVFSADPSAVVTYNPQQFEAVQAAYKLGQIAIGVGLRYNVAHDTDKAKSYWEAGYCLGLAMCRERLVYLEFMRGQDLMRTAAQNLQGIDPSFGSVDGAYRGLIDSYKPMMDIFNPSNPATISTNAGDVFNLAQHSSERMWKIEAILMLGHFRYNAAQPGDQRAADTVLTQMAAAKPTDPAVAAAIKAAQDLTSEQHGNSQEMPAE